MDTARAIKEKITTESLTYFNSIPSLKLPFNTFKFIKTLNSTTSLGHHLLVKLLTKFQDLYSH